MAKDSNDLMMQGASEKDIKMFNILRSNVMMAGCRKIKPNNDDEEEGEGEHNLEQITVMNDFEQRRYSFVSPVFYEFTRRVGKTEIVLNKSFA